MIYRFEDLIAFVFHLGGVIVQAGDALQTILGGAFKGLAAKKFYAFQNLITIKPRRLGQQQTIIFIID